MAPTERTPRTAGLDGLRAVAALSVLCLHVWLYGQPDPGRPTRDGVLEHAAFELRLGLVFFFVLSGYLLYRAFAAAALRGSRPVDVGRYARRRFARIVPAYWLSLGGAVALLWGARGEPGVRLPDAEELPLFAVFAQNYSPETFMTLNPVSWTLCLEVAFYVALPVIGWGAWRLSRRRGSDRLASQLKLLAALVASGLGFAAADYYAGWDPIVGKALPAYLPHFAMGMLVAVWAERRRVRASGPLSSAATAALAGGGFALAFADAVWHATARTPAGDPLLSIVGDVPAAVGFAAVVAAAVAGRGPGVGWMHVRPLAWVGLVSYGVYLWHVPMLLFARSYDLLPSAFLPALAAVLPPVLAVSAASWYLVERPLIARAERPRGDRARRRADRDVLRERRARARLEAHAAP